MATNEHVGGIITVCKHVVNVRTDNNLITLAICTDGIEVVSTLSIYDGKRLRSLLEEALYEAQRIGPPRGPEEDRCALCGSSFRRDGSCPLCMPKGMSANQS